MPDARQPDFPQVAFESTTEISDGHENGGRWGQSGSPYYLCPPERLGLADWRSRQSLGWWW
jgi:hypothetical protein